MGFRPPPGDWSSFVVLCAANSWDSVKVADQHLAEALARHVPVLYVDPPLSWLTALRHPELRDSVRKPRLRPLGSGLARLTPVVLPGAQRPVMNVVAPGLVRRELRRATAAIGGQVLAILTAWPLTPVFGACDERRRVFWAQDDFVGGAVEWGLSPALMARGQAAAAASADVIIAANPTVAKTHRANGIDPLLIPFGYDEDTFAGVDDAPLPADVRLPSPIVGQVGQLNHRMDLALLEAVADQGHSVLLVGPRSGPGGPDFDERLARFVARPNVQGVGAKPFAELPSYLRVIDVGVVPYTDSEFNRGSFPLKTLEYLGSGKPVVATELPAIRWLDTDLISVASEPAAFAAAVAAALADNDPQRAERCRTFASAHSWARRAEAFADAMGVPRRTATESIGSAS